MINTIAGGLTLAGSSNHARKKYARRLQNNFEMLSIGSNHRATKRHKSGYAPIIFNEEDEIAMVNIFFLPAYEEMEISLDELLQAATPLQGFTGDSVDSVGSIRLPLSLGSSTTEDHCPH
ncbi:hypothetical protein M0R45_006905 [Rubus argutus]|uniref:Uncharacterized protein n=1 Tax=Rubus argutus TaxID=59490 RepID=A0AAW1YS95_RUBAR